MDKTEIEGVALEEQAAEKDIDAPTGRCRITAGNIKQCFNGLTLNSCNQVAIRVGGVADWDEGKTCP